jgi:hypothetical protein
MGSMLVMEECESNRLGPRTSQKEVVRKAEVSRF